MFWLYNQHAASRILLSPKVIDILEDYMNLNFLEHFIQHLFKLLLICVCLHWYCPVLKQLAIHILECVARHKTSTHQYAIMCGPSQDVYPSIPYNVWPVTRRLPINTLDCVALH